MGQSGVKQDALSSYGQNSQNAQSAYNTVSPLYQQMASGTDGYTPTQLSNLYTASAQSSGGGQAAAVGAGNLLAARDNNIGGLGTAISDSARQAGIANSSNALQIQNQNTSLENQRQMQALSGLSSLYSGSDSEANANLGSANNAAKPFWQQALLQGIQSAGQAATGNLGG